nr:hypothetical protein [Acinetobacter junii]
MTVHIAKVVTLPDNLQGLTNLAGARIGASIVSCSDEFFASAERMIQPEPAKNLLKVSLMIMANGWMAGKHAVSAKLVMIGVLFA